MGLSKKHLKAFQGKRFYSSVLFENAPQLASQIYFLILLGSLDEATMIALLSSTVSMILSVVDIWSANRLVRVMKKQEKLGQAVVSIEFRIDTENQAHDEIEIYKRFFLGKPNALSKAIAETLVVHHRNIEIYQLIAAHPGIKVGFTVYSVNNDAHLMIDKLKSELKKFQLLVSIKWKMKTYPNIINIHEGHGKGQQTVTLAMGLNGDTGTTMGTTTGTNDNEYSRDMTATSTTRTRTRTRSRAGSVYADTEKIDGNTYQTDQVPNMMSTSGIVEGRGRAMSKSTTYSQAASKRLLRISRMDSGMVKKLKRANLEYLEEAKSHSIESEEDEASISLDPGDLPMDIIYGDNDRFDTEKLWNNFKSFKTDKTRQHGTNMTMSSASPVPFQFHFGNPIPRANVEQGHEAVMSESLTITMTNMNDGNEDNNHGDAVMPSSLSNDMGKEAKLKFMTIESSSNTDLGAIGTTGETKKKRVHFNISTGMSGMSTISQGIPEMAEYEYNENVDGNDNGLIDENEWNKYIDNMEKLIQFHQENMNENEGKTEEIESNTNTNVDIDGDNGTNDDSEWLLTMENMRMLLNVREQIKLKPDELLAGRSKGKSITEFKEFTEDGMDTDNEDEDENEDKFDENDAKFKMDEKELASMIDEMNAIQIEDDDEMPTNILTLNSGNSSIIPYDRKRISVKL